MNQSKDLLVRDRRRHRRMLIDLMEPELALWGSS
jgi:hypothetical protein